MVHGWYMMLARTDCFVEQGTMRKRQRTNEEDDDGDDRDDDELGSTTGNAKENLHFMLCYFALKKHIVGMDEFKLYKNKYNINMSYDDKDFALFEHIWGTSANNNMRAAGMSDEQYFYDEIPEVDCIKTKKNMFVPSEDDNDDALCFWRKDPGHVDPKDCADV